MSFYTSSELVELITSHLTETEERLQRAQLANKQAEQRLGEALGYDITVRYPALPQLVMQVVDIRKELLHLRSIVSNLPTEPEDHR